LRFKVRALVGDRARLERMREAARAASHPHAAGAVIGAIPRIIASRR
jgi:hypothetical protein